MDEGKVNKSDQKSVKRKTDKGQNKAAAAEEEAEDEEEEEEKQGLVSGNPDEEAEEGRAGLVWGKRRQVYSSRYKQYKEQQDRSVSEKTRGCPYCHKTFSSAPGLRYHLQSHAPYTRRYVCHRCKKEFKSHNGLKYHQMKTKCLEPPPPLLPSPQIPELPPSSTPPSAVCPESEQLCHPSSQRNVRLSPPRDEIDSMTDGCPAQPWPQAEPRHRKMEARRRQLQQQLLQTQRGPEHSQSGALLEFANIATGPQSPLLNRSIDWGIPSWASTTSPVLNCTAITSTVTSVTAARGGVESCVKEAFSVTSLPHALCDSLNANDVRCPVTAWQCFMKGSHICVNEELSLWYSAESLAGSVLQTTLPEDLSAPVPLKLLEKKPSSDEVTLRFECESALKSRLSARCVQCHPFYVRSKGWSSCSVPLTEEAYNLRCRWLEVGDVCLPSPASYPPPISLADSQGSEVDSLELSSVVALSAMKQVREKQSREGSGGHTVTSPVLPHAPKAKRPMNAFLLWSQTKRPEFIHKYPHVNNRDISSMLSREWKRMGEAEKRQLQKEARSRAEKHMQQFPNCWKRKPHAQ